MQETQETWVQSLVQEDPLEEEMATHSSILAWKIPWTEETGGPWGRKELETTEWVRMHQVQQGEYRRTPSLPCPSLRELWLHLQSPPRATQDPWSCLPPSRTRLVSFPNSCRSTTLSPPTPQWEWLSLNEQRPKRSRAWESDGERRKLDCQSNL